MTEEITRFEVGKRYGHKPLIRDYFTKTVQITRTNNKSIWFKVEGDDKEYRRKIRFNIFLVELIWFDGYTFLATNEVK